MSSRRRSPTISRNRNPDRTFSLAAWPQSTPQVLALGPELKANFTAVRQNVAVWQSGFEDIKDPAHYARYRTAVVAQLKRFTPDLLVHDLHPAFFSTRLAQELAQQRGFRRLAVQHHHAHVAAAAVALGLGPRPLVGIVCDGTGWGSDGHVWGMEILRCEGSRMHRLSHCAYIPLPGADQAVRQPWRIALGLLRRAYGNDLSRRRLAWLPDKQAAIPVIERMIEKNINTPLASSAGRLFDAVAALCGVCLEVTEEAQAPRLLEQLAQSVITARTPAYPFGIESATVPVQIDPIPTVRAITEDLEAGVAVAEVSARFHLSFSQMVIEAATQAAEREKLTDVVLCGGVFFNSLVRPRVQAGLEERGFNVWCAPAPVLGDNGISIGQAVIGYVFRNSGSH